MPPPPHSPIVTAEWLYSQLQPADRPVPIVIIDCRFSLADPNLGQQQYATAHIPGAFYLDLNQDLSSPVQRHGGRHPLPDPAILSEKLSALGITTAPSEDSTVDSTISASTIVVAYDDSRFAFASRLWWLLRYLGHDRVFVLDGGFHHWQNAGYPVTAGVPAAPPASQFMPRPHSEWVVNIETVKARKDLVNVILVDSREPERYRGDREPIDPIAGHIPGAVNFPWQAVTTEQGFMRSASELQQHFSLLADQSTAAIDSEIPDPEISDPEILVYCGSGVTACVNLLALAHAGFNPGKLYAGSWSDWCSYL